MYTTVHQASATAKCLFHNFRVNREVKFWGSWSSFPSTYTLRYECLSDRQRLLQILFLSGPPPSLLSRRFCCSLTDLPSSSTTSRLLATSQMAYCHGPHNCGLLQGKQRCLEISMLGKIFKSLGWTVFLTQASSEPVERVLKSSSAETAMYLSNSYHTVTTSSFTVKHQNMISSNMIISTGETKSTC